MKNFISIVILLLTTITASAKQYKAETVKNDPMGVKIYTLDNGLRVYLSVNKEKPRICAHIAVGTGSKNDPAETTGLAHYLEHLMFKGTQQYGTTNYSAEKPYLDEIEQRYEKYRTITDPELRRQKYHEIDSLSQIAAQWFIPNEYDKLMSQIGADGTNAYTSYDETVYTEDIPANEVENWAKIQADRFKSMVIRGFHTELEAVYEEYNINLTQDQNKIFDSMFAKLFPTHPYGTQTTIGTQDHLKNPSITNIKNYFNTYYCPNNVAICLAGDLDPDKTMDIIERYFGDWKPNTSLRKPVHAPVPDITMHKDTTVVGLEAESIWLGWKAEKASSLQCDTLEVLNCLLTNDKAGLIDLNLNNQMAVLTAGTGLESLADYSVYLAYGMPNEGQSLDEVKELILGEIEKIKRGDFSEDMLTAAINNKKLHDMSALENNRGRVSKMVNAFIQGTPWEQIIHETERFSAIKKADIVEFANRFFKDNYVAVYKRQGVDTNQKKIDKPVITPIPTNREFVSNFVKEVQNCKTEPIKPQFVDFKRDMTVGKTKNGNTVLYKKNDENDRFTLNFAFDFGEESDIRYQYALEILDYLGTKRLNSAAIQTQFYQLACTMEASVNSHTVSIKLNGLNENIKPALALLNDIITNSVADKDAWEAYIEQILKMRADQKADQKANFNALSDYADYGEYNSTRNILTEQQLRNTDLKKLLSLVKGLKNYQHTIMYYGPSAMNDLIAMIEKQFPTAKKPVPVPAGRPYTRQTTPVNEVLIAPYDAKNIYMTMNHNENREWKVENAAVEALFNEYYGGGMNTVVFQEMREARGLAYGAAAYYRTPSRIGEYEHWFTYIITQNDKMTDCINHFNHIINEMPASEGAFDIAKDALIKRLSSQRTTKYNILEAYMKARQLEMDKTVNELMYNDVPKLNLQDIINFEQETMANKPLRYVILGDENELDMDFLRKIGPIKRLSTEDIFGY